jgi:hypothetical protein
MSQIKKALEKAKRERELFSIEVREQAPLETSYQDQQEPTKVRLAEEEAQNLASSDITPPIYSQT